MTGCRTQEVRHRINDLLQLLRLQFGNLRDEEIAIETEGSDPLEFDNQIHHRSKPRIMTRCTHSTVS